MCIVQDHYILNKNQFYTDSGVKGFFFFFFSFLVVLLS